MANEYQTTLKKNTGSIFMGMVWMAVISLLLFWLPFIGPLLGGIVGGKKSGGVINGLIAAFLPSVFFGIALFILASVLTGVPLIGVIAAMGGFILAVSQIGPLVLGAVIGGLLI